MKIMVRAALATAILAAPTAAHAQQDCKAVLMNGTRAYTQVFKVDYVRHFLIKKLEQSRSSSRSSSKKNSGAVGFDGLELKLGRNEALTKEEEDYLKTFLVSDFESDQSYQQLVSSGDPQILKTWLECAKDKEGLVAYFENVSAETANLNIRWVRSTNPDSKAFVRLTQDIPLPSWVRPIDDGQSARCWKAPARGGRKGDGEISTSGCIVTLELLDPKETFRRTLSITVSSRESKAAAMLPPRVAYDVDTKPLGLSADVWTAPTGKNGSRDLSAVRYLPPHLAAQGYRFVPGSFLGVSSEQTTGTHRRWFTRCYDARADVTGQFVRLTATVANESHIAINCRIGGAIDAAKIVEVPSFKPVIQLSQEAVVERDESGIGWEWLNRGAIAALVTGILLGIAGTIGFGALRARATRPAKPAKSARQAEKKD